MSAAHTPGPWVVGGRYGRIGYEISGGGKSIAIVNRVGSKRLAFVDGVRSKAAKKHEPAWMAEQEARELEETDAEARANARIMVAAPDLLDAISRWLEYDDVDLLGRCEYGQSEAGACVGDGDFEPVCPACELRAAIAKARGEG